MMRHRYSGSTPATPRSPAGDWHRPRAPLRARLSAPRIHLAAHAAAARDTLSVSLSSIRRARRFDLERATDFGFTGHRAPAEGGRPMRSGSRATAWSRRTGRDRRALPGARRCRACRAARADNTEIPGHRPPWIVPYQYLMRVPGSRSPSVSSCARGPSCARGWDSAAALREPRPDRRGVPRALRRAYIESAHKTDGMARYLAGLHWDTVDGWRCGTASCACRCLLVWGEDDPDVPDRARRAMIPQFANCRGLTPVPGTKLLPHEENRRWSPGSSRSSARPPRTLSATRRCTSRAPLPARAGSCLPRGRRRDGPSGP
jgi:hypothetical protein